MTVPSGHAAREGEYRTATTRRHSHSATAAQLQHVRWIGGGSGAGKSTAARRLAADGRLQVYSCDGAMAQHARRSNPSDDPLLRAFLNMSMDERWLDRPPSVMFQTFHWFQGEGFDWIVEDLLDLPSEPLILAEGFRLLPRLVAPLLSWTNQAVWLIPTPEFRRAALESRGSLWEIPCRTSDPGRALTNILLRDRLFTDQVSKEASALQLRAIDVDVDLRLDELARRVAECLGLNPRDGPPPPD